MVVSTSLLLQLSWLTLSDWFQGYSIEIQIFYCLYSSPSVPAVRAPTSVRAPRGSCRWPCPGRSQRPCRTGGWVWPQLSSNYCFCPGTWNV